MLGKDMFYSHFILKATTREPTNVVIKHGKCGCFRLRSLFLNGTRKWYGSQTVDDLTPNQCST